VWRMSSGAKETVSDDGRRDDVTKFELSANF
jgi:hypothetical protein